MNKELLTKLRRNGGVQKVEEGTGNLGGIQRCCLSIWGQH